MTTTVDDVRRALMGKPPREVTAVKTTKVDAPTAVPPPPVNATDAAIKLADDNGIDLATVTGTGTDGRILLADVKALIDQ